MHNNAKIDDYLKLPKNQREYIRLKAESDYTNRQLAEMLSVHPTTISRWKQTEAFTLGQAGFQANYLSAAVPKAMRTMIDLLCARSEMVRFNASKDILDRCGYYPIEKSEQEIKQRNIVVNVGEWSDDDE